MGIYIIVCLVKKSKIPSDQIKHILKTASNILQNLHIVQFLKNIPLFGITVYHIAVYASACPHLCFLS